VSWGDNRRRAQQWRPAANGRAAAVWPWSDGAALTAGRRALWGRRR
jgi:hypothetical protein